MVTTTLPITEFDGYSLDFLAYRRLISAPSAANRAYRNTLFPAATRKHGTIHPEHFIHTLRPEALDPLVWDVMEQQHVLRVTPTQELFLPPAPAIDPWNDDTTTQVTTAYHALVYGTYGNSVKRMSGARLPFDPQLAGWEKYVNPVLAWARDVMELTRIYCITEHRPYVDSTNWVLNATYFTVTGSK
jgi:hypothetical protein